jgi:exopolyphosphatase/guanosine-5'-triphosphate,3'-diphosphate pyrophosphatase
VVNRLNHLSPAYLQGGQSPEILMSTISTNGEVAQGRLPGHGPVAVIDIGSNSVRLVVYERLSRALTPLFNEKVLSGLGRGLGETGVLSEDSCESALNALHRYRMLADQMQVVDIYPIATAAVREAQNGAAFISKASKILRSDIEILSGESEAKRAALGVVSGIWEPDGIVGDLGGGSLELIDVRNQKLGEGESLPLGGIRLQDDSEKSPAQARKIAEEWIKKAVVPPLGRDRTLYLIGGTWRSLARLHMAQNNHPLHVMHAYEMQPDDLISFCKSVVKDEVDDLDKIDVVSKNRRALIPYGAAVLEKLVSLIQPSRIVVSALGVREGLLYEKLSLESQKLDPLIEACDELAVLRSRSPKHARELPGWTESLFAASGIGETPYEARLRRAGCLLAGIGWRAHPDYRGKQSLNIIAHAAFVGIDHPGRAYLALANFFRYEGQVDDELSPDIWKLADARLRERARALGAALRLAYVLSAAMPGVLPQIRFVREDDTLWLVLPKSLEFLDGERLRKRLGQYGKLANLETDVLIRD